jgi:hypothetical protein
MHLIDDDLDLPGADRASAKRLLVLAYTRLYLKPAREDGTKLANIAAFGPFEVRLIEVQGPQHDALTPPWVELYDRAADRVLDSAGCRDLEDAAGAVEVFMEEARRLSDIAPLGRGWAALDRRAI